MKIFIIEDEQPAARRLSKMIMELGQEIEIVGLCESIETSIEWLEANPAPDLIVSDIQLSDGLSFEVFRQVEVTSPIIFTTAYDEYAINAFKLNSIDYLLKPVKGPELVAAFEKYHQRSRPAAPSFNSEQFEAFMAKMLGQKYKERFLIKFGDKLIAVGTKEVNYFFSEGGLTFMMNRTGKKYMVDHTLEELESLLDPRYFFRINRQFLAGFQGIKSIHTHFNSKLKIILEPHTDKEVFVSRDKAGVFKEWLDQ
jgi:two-component system, LytTR family, response regulator LytT